MLANVIGRGAQLSPTDIMDVRIAYGAAECPLPPPSNPVGAFVLGDSRVADLAAGHSVSDRLDESDAQWANGRRYHSYEYAGTSGEVLTVRMDPVGGEELDPYLLVFRGGPGERLVAQNDDLDRRTRSAELSIALEHGRYTIVATSYAANEVGGYRAGRQQHPS